MLLPIYYTLTFYCFQVSRTALETSHELLQIIVLYCPVKD